MSEGYIIKSHNQQVKRYCQTLELKNNPDLIEEYKFWHKSEMIWADIPRGIKEVGILEMEIYIHENKLFMIVETPLDFNWKDAFDKLAKLDRQAEWEDFMSKFQIVEQGKSSAAKWQLMERMFCL